MSKRWNKEELNEAIELHSVGLKWDEIADRLNRTEKSVRLKLNKEGLVQNKEIVYENVVCENCGETFQSLIKDNRKYCSRSCSATINNKKYPKRDKQNKIFIDSNTGLLDDAKRKKYYTNKCKNCGDKTKNKYYCSNKCQG